METCKDIAKRVIEDASSLFAEREKAHAAFDTARKEFETEKRRHDEAVRKFGVGSREDALASADKAKAEADLEVSRIDLRNVEARIPAEVEKMLTAGRESAEKAMNPPAKPETIDRNALDLLQAGVLTLDEVAGMLDGYRDEGNEAMKRLALKRAKEMRDEAAGNGATPMNDEGYSRLSVAIAECSDGEQRRAFHDLFDLVSRTANNRAMLPYFENAANGILGTF